MVDFGAYLGTEEEQVLLPKKQVPEGANVGVLPNSIFCLSVLFFIVYLILALL